MLIGIKPRPSGPRNSRRSRRSPCTPRSRRAAVVAAAHGAPKAEEGQAVRNVIDRMFQCVVALLLLVVRPGAPSSVLAPSSDALCY